jgi:hypothetical protein
VFRIGRSIFYDQKNKILMKILEFMRSGIGLIAEFRRIPNRFPNQARHGLDSTGAGLSLSLSLRMYKVMDIAPLGLRSSPTTSLNP